jgi:hypothetical protein
MLVGSLLYFVGQHVVRDPDKHSEQHRAVVTATTLRDGRLRNLVLIPGRERRFFSLQSIQTDPGVHMASYSIGIWGSFARGKQPELQADHSLHLMSRSKKSGVTPPFPQVPICNVKE